MIKNETLLKLIYNYSQRPCWLEADDISVLSKTYEGRALVHPKTKHDPHSLNYHTFCSFLHEEYTIRSIYSKQPFSIFICRSQKLIY